MESVHLKMKQLHCEVCGKGCNSKQELNIHSFVHKAYSERPYGCSDCSKRFCNETELKYHQNTCQLSKVERNALIKQDPKNYCNLCSKFYANLREHLRRNHSSEKKFHCEICGYGVNSLQELSRHTFIHKSINSRDFECESCKMKYITLSELKDHQKQGGKPTCRPGRVKLTSPVFTLVPDISTLLRVKWNFYYTKVGYFMNFHLVLWSEDLNIQNC